MNGNTHGAQFNDFVRSKSLRAFRLNTHNALLALPLLFIIFGSVAAPATEGDAPENFEYFARPYTMISDFGFPEETQVTPEGAFRTHAGTLSLDFGGALNHAKPLQRLRDGQLPILEYSITQDGIRYNLVAFALASSELSKIPYKASLLNLKDYFKVVKIDNLVNFIRIDAVNSSDEKSSFSVSLRYELGDGIPMQVDYLSREFIYFDWKGRDFKLSPDGLSFGDDKEILWCFDSPFSAMRDTFSIRGELAPNSSKSVTIRLPYFPAPRRDLKTLSRLSFEKSLQQKIAFWRDLRRKTLAIAILENKPLHTLYASQMYILDGCLDHVGGRYILRANPFQYDQFYIRDATFMVLALDATGMNDLAEKCLDHFLESQDDDGRFASQKTQYDANGMALYALGEHFNFTHNEKWARRILPKVARSMAWLYNFREDTPSGKALLPRSTIRDNEQINDAHIVGDNLWALAGMRGAITIARAAGKNDLAQLWQSQYDEYLDVVKQMLTVTASRNDNLITPAFEGFAADSNTTGRFDRKYGFDWGNLTIAYPSRVLAPFDPITNTCMSYWRKFFREGLFPYPENGDENLVHHYLTIDITQTSLVRGETSRVLNDLYEGLLLHTTHANAGCERIDLARRDFQPPSNVSPHGTFAAKYMLLFRNLFIREDGNDLHLLSCLSPAWLKPSESIHCLRAPTHFGEMSFVLDIKENGGHLQLMPPKRNPPARIIVHLPDWLNITSALCDNLRIEISPGNLLYIPANSRSLLIAWTEQPHEEISFDSILKKFIEREETKVER